MVQRVILSSEYPKIVARRRTGETQRQIGDSYGVSASLIGQICRAHGVYGLQIWKPHHYYKFFRGLARAARYADETAKPDEPLFPHGQAPRCYRRGCRCPVCRDAIRLYYMERRKINGMFFHSRRWGGKE